VLNAVDGTIDPGWGSIGQIGTVTITKSLTDQGLLVIGINGAGGCDLVACQGQVGLCGMFGSSTLRVNRDPDYTPEAGTLTFLEAASINGDFFRITINSWDWIAPDNNPYKFVPQEGATSYDLVVAPNY
jgi:hypothetical protein